MAAAPRKPSVRVPPPAIWSMFGSMYEWYDFASFAAFSSEIGSSFFPYATSSSRLLLTFMLYGSSFVLHPLGALIFGEIGDNGEGAYFMGDESFRGHTRGTDAKAFLYLWSMEEQSAACKINDCVYFSLIVFFFFWNHTSCLHARAGTWAHTHFAPLSSDQSTFPFVCLRPCSDHTDDFSSNVRFDRPNVAVHSAIDTSDAGHSRGRPIARLPGDSDEKLQG